MQIASENQALDILHDVTRSSELRVKAARYLSGNHAARIIQNLVQALQDDDFGVRWEAAEALAKCGSVALPEMLKALTDPKRVSDPRVRRSIYHVLHEIDDPELQRQTAGLMEALRGPAAAIAAMMAAGALQLKRQTEKAAQLRSTRGRPAN